MIEKNIKACRIVVGLVFVLNFLVEIFGGNISIYTVLILGGFLLMAVSMFTGIYLLFAVGAGMECIHYLFQLFHMRRFIHFLSAASCLLCLLAYILVIMLILKKERAFTLSIAAAACITVGRTLSLFYGVDDVVKYASMIVSTLRIVFLSVSLPILLVGLIVASVPMTEPKKLAIGNSHSESSDNRVEKLTQLKGLLDCGAITQEEFDAKKKQLLEL